MTNDSPLPNPQKEASTKFPIEKVKEAIKQLPNFTESAVIVYSSDVMGFYKFEVIKKGIFNFGMFLDISVHEVSENQTRIILECRRRIGWINLSSEYAECVEYMVGCIGLLGKVLTGEVKK